MKFSSKLAAYGLMGRALGRKLSSGMDVDSGPDWKDALYAAIIAKNEVLDGDGEIRQRIENGVSDEEIERLERERDAAIREAEALRAAKIRDSQPVENRGLASRAFRAFVKGLKGESV